MLIAEIKKEIIITNKEIAEFLYRDKSILERIDEILEDMLYNEYKMDYDSRCDAVAELTAVDYAQILIFFANKLSEEE